MEITDIFNDLESRMNGSIASLQHNLKGLRTGRASVNLLDNLQVEIYGSKMPVNQLANVSVSDAKTLIVQAWDKESAKPIEKAISKAELGLNPILEGQTIRINIPPISEDRRKELVKVAYRYGEEAKIAARNVRRDIMDVLKKKEKEKDISEDELRTHSNNVQKHTDDYIKKIDGIIKNKEKDILGN